MTLINLTGLLQAKVSVKISSVRWCLWPIFFLFVYRLLQLIIITPLYNFAKIHRRFRDDKCYISRRQYPRYRRFSSGYWQKDPRALVIGLHKPGRLLPPIVNANVIQPLFYNAQTWRFWLYQILFAYHCSD